MEGFVGSTVSASKTRTPPPSIDVPSKRGGYVLKEHARLVVLWRLPHVAIAPKERRPSKGISGSKPSRHWVLPFG